MKDNISQTESPKYSEPTFTGEIELTDYPYIGIGRKPKTHHSHISIDDALDRIMNG